jgi:hypothetical protein
MKKVLLYTTMLLASFSLLPGCSSDDGLDELTDNYINGTNSGTTANTTSDVASFDIAINTTSLSEAESVPADDNDYEENTSFTKWVNIVFNGESATCEGDIDDTTIKVTATGAHVTVESTTDEFVVYTLSGSTTNGSLKVNSNKKFKLQLAGVSITNPTGAAINIQSSKRAFIVVADGTTNTLTDGSSYTSYTSGEDLKGCFFSEGQLIFSGKGMLSVYGNCTAAIKKDGTTVTASAIRSDDYIVIRPNTNIYVKASAGNGIKGNEALNIYGGVVNVETSAKGVKGIASDGNILISGGRTTVITSGASVYDSSENDIAGSACLKADSVFTITGGELYTKNTGQGGKGISVDMQARFQGGTVGVITMGATYRYSNSLDSKAKGIKADGEIIVSGSNLKVRSTGGEGSEGTESKSVMTVESGSVAVYAYDDAINSASHLYIKGGTVYAHSTGNDGLDSNGNMYIQGGNIFAYGSKAPECGIDANEEGGYTVYITGGNVFAIGGGNSVPNNSASTQGYVSASGSVSGGATASISDGTNTLATFTLPASYSNGSILVTASGMTAGSAYILSIGDASTTLTAQQYGSSGMGGGGNPQGGGPGGGPRR